MQPSKIFNTFKTSQSFKKIFFTIAILLSIITITFSSSFFSKNFLILKYNQKIKNPIFEQFEEKYLLVFFGYVGCADICTPRLSELSLLYKKLIKADTKSPKNIKILFVDIAGEKDPALPELFAKYFNEDFGGIWVDDVTKKQLIEEFNLRIEPSLFEEGEYNHGAFLYLLKREIGDKNIYTLKKVYTFANFNHKVLQEELENLDLDLDKDKDN